MHHTTSAGPRQHPRRQALRLWNERTRDADRPSQQRTNRCSREALHLCPPRSRTLRVDRSWATLPPSARCLLVLPALSVGALLARLHAHRTHLVRVDPLRHLSTPPRARGAGLLDLASRTARAFLEREPDQALGFRLCLDPVCARELPRSRANVGETHSCQRRLGEPKSRASKSIDSSQ